ncbi:hypothetical protein [Burkholderia cenocepacia]|jgi:hypothetical protein|uniref:hypothetical protein n=1 Tax=Burkholderia cenocepacia TaxID=95486 RepID=UPI00078B9DFC|nr:hypothetical protein [Burkholderia cenocepacia]AMU15171.1 hypothetical protein A3203_19700 [Burkholderia cenocepacia]MEB2544035.1 hypothetical protein [Burkholderia cenocepacia]
MSFEYIRKHYGVPAERGRQVKCYGERGVIVNADGHYLCVVIDGDKTEEERLYHPTDQVEYGEIVDTPVLREWRCLAPWRDEFEYEAWFTVTASTRSKARYKAFLDLRDVCDMTGRDLIRIRVRASPRLKPGRVVNVPPSDDPDLPF